MSGGELLAAIGIVCGFLLLALWLLRRDKSVGITRIGVFLERERYDDEDEESAEQITRSWPTPPE